jgi:hypothetical protein
MKIDQIIGYFNQHKINLIPPFQRGTVWNLATRQTNCKYDSGAPDTCGISFINKPRAHSSLTTSLTASNGSKAPLGTSSSDR